MREISAENYAALQARKLVARDFIWFIVRDRVTGDPVTDGYWSDVGTITAEVLDPNTGAIDERQWFGSGTLIQVSDIPLVSNLTVQTVAVRLSQVADRVNQLVRDYDCKQGQVQIFRGLFDPNSRQMVAPAESRFVGFIDTIDIQTPAENSDGGVTLNCVSHTQEMTRSNPDTRSHESQIRRHAGDNFLQDTTVVGGWELFWGKANGPVPTAAPANSNIAKIAYDGLVKGLFH
ncbi:hypothetical protein ACSVBT_07095 [Afipia sp. TerB]